MRIPLRFVVAFLLLAALLGAIPAQSAGPYSETKLLASDSAPGDYFAYHMAAAGDRIVVGAFQDDDNGADSGSVYVFEPDGAGGWAETKLTASDGAPNDWFGRPVAVSGDRIVVGAPHDNDNGDESGSAYVFEPDGADGWAETKLTASDGGPLDEFGRRVAVSGDRIVVGAPGDDDNGSYAGSAYVYEPDGAGGWAETKLTASDGATWDEFGWAVAVSGDRIVVGAYGNNAAYVYEPDGAGGWAETKLTASDGATSNNFGVSVAAAGDRIVVGASSDDDNGIGSGSAYVYEPDGAGGWIGAKLTANDASPDDRFGEAMAASGDLIVVGAAFDDDNGGESGSAYVYEPDGAGGWAETKLTASDGVTWDIFGTSVAVAGDRIVVGAPYDDDNGDGSGSVYVYEPGEPTVLAIEFGTANVNHEWTTVALTESFTDPVVVSGPASSNGPQPVTVRIRDVTPTGFEIKLDEYEYLDGWHKTEQVDYLVVERGHHTLPGGAQIVAGSIETSATRTPKWTTFGVELPSIPAIFTTVASHHGPDAVVTRVTYVNESGFGVMLQEQEANPKWHLPERVDYIAWEKGTTGTGDPIGWETTTAEVNHQLTTITYAGTYPAGGCVIADMNTRQGNDTAGLRWHWKHPDGIGLQVDDEQSNDPEVWHLPETVVALAIDCP